MRHVFDCREVCRCMFAARTAFIVAEDQPSPQNSAGASRHRALRSCRPNDHVRVYLPQTSGTGAETLVPCCRSEQCDECLRIRQHPKQGEKQYLLERIHHLRRLAPIAQIPEMLEKHHFLAKRTTRLITTILHEIPSYKLEDMHRFSNSAACHPHFQSIALGRDSVCRRTNFPRNRPRSKDGCFQRTG